MFKNAMTLMNLDVKKMPLGKLTKQQIARGFEALEALEEAMKKTLRECCDTQDSVACFSTQSPLLKRQLTSFIEKGQEMCADYSENTFTEYKKKLAERLRTKTPNTSPAELKDMVEKHSDFASKCCSINSPPLYCSSQIDAEMIDTLQS